MSESTNMNFDSMSEEDFNEICKKFLGHELDLPQKAPSNNVDLNALLKITSDNVISTRNLITQTIDNTQSIAELNQVTADLNNRMKQREQSETLSTSQRKVLKRCVTKRVYALLGIKRVNGKLSDDSKRVRNVYGSLFFARLYSHIKNTFEVSELSEVRAIDFDKARGMVNEWVPEGGAEALKLEAEENWTINHPEVDLNTYLGRLL